MWGVPTLIDEYFVLKIKGSFALSGPIRRFNGPAFWLCSLPWTWINVFDVERTFGFSRVDQKKHSSEIKL